MKFSNDNKTLILAQILENIPHHYSGNHRRTYECGPYIGQQICQCNGRASVNIASESTTKKLQELLSTNIKNARDYIYNGSSNANESLNNLIHRKVCSISPIFNFNISYFCC